MPRAATAGSAYTAAFWGDSFLSKVHRSSHAKKSPTRKRSPARRRAAPASRCGSNSHPGGAHTPRENHTAASPRRPPPRSLLAPAQAAGAPSHSQRQQRPPTALRPARPPASGPSRARPDGPEEPAHRWPGLPGRQEHRVLGRGGRRRVLPVDSARPASSGGAAGARLAWCQPRTLPSQARRAGRMLLVAAPLRWLPRWSLVVSQSSSSCKLPASTSAQPHNPAEPRASSPAQPSRRLQRADRRTSTA